MKKIKELFMVGILLAIILFKVLIMVLSQNVRVLMVDSLQRLD